MGVPCNWSGVFLCIFINVSTKLTGRSAATCTKVSLPLLFLARTMPNSCGYGGASLNEEGRTTPKPKNVLSCLVDDYENWFP